MDRITRKLKPFFSNLSRWIDFRLVVSVLLFLTLFCDIYISSLAIQNVQVSNAYGQSYSLGADSLFEYDKLFPTTDKRVFLLSGTVYRFPFSRTTLRIVPDDCILNVLVNDENIDLPVGVNSCDARNGFDIDLGKYLKQGDNRVDFVMKDNGGKAGIIFRNSYSDPVFLFLTFLLACCLVFPCWKIFRRLNFSKSLLHILVLGFLVRIVYLGFTPYDVRSYDYWGHIDYIKFISSNLAIPPMDACWQCYHPPIYYILSSVPYSLASVFGLSHESVIQLFSIFSSMLFSVFGILIIRRFVSDKWLLILSSALLVFWPSSIIHSVRVGNDNFLYLLFSISLLFTCRWWESFSRRDFSLALIFSILATLTKSNGIISLIILLLLFLIKFSSLRFDRKFLKQYFFIALPIGLIGLVLILCRPFFEYQSGKDWLVRNQDGLPEQIRVENTFLNYVSFDFPAYFSDKYIDPWKAENGRDNFWNYLLNSSLYGEFDFGFRISPYYKFSLSFNLFLLVLYILFGLLVMMKRRNVMKYLPILLLFVLLLLAIIFLRYRLPFAPSNDFRYILPILIPSSISYGTGLKYLFDNGFRKIAFVGILVAVTFFLSFSLPIFFDFL